MDGKRPFFARRSGLEGWRDPVPGQELVEAAYGMAVGHALEHVLQVSVGLAVVELSGADQRADDGPAVGAAIGPGEKMVFAPKGNRPNGALPRVGIVLDAAVVEEPAEGWPASEGITD